MARIGLLSDSHGRAGSTQRAVELLLSHEVDHLLHLGDIGTVEVIDALAVDQTVGPDASVSVHIVFGNTDWDFNALADYARELGIHVDHPVGRLPLEEGEQAAEDREAYAELVFCHGHQPKPMRQAIDRGVRYLCHGHTHRTEDARRGSTRIINPGALFRAQQYTVAVLDTATDQLEFFPV